jgi:glycosyltransferase involved in cell wall biosynthesis
MENNGFVFTQGAGVLSRVARQFRPDLLHSTQFCFGALPLDTPKLITAHSDVLTWADACRPRGLERSRWLQQYQSLVTQGLQSCDAIAFPTRWMALELARHYSALPPSYVIRNGRTFDPPVSRLRAVQAVTVGGLWDEAKNIEMLREVNSPVPIYVAGERQLGNSVTPRQVGRSILLGALPESSLLTLEARSSIYIETSIYEPFGMAPLEAALCGCAVVANDIPSVREVWGDDALYFDGPRALSTLLLQLSRGERQLAEARGRSLARAKELTAQGMTEGYEALYKALLDSRPEAQPDTPVKPPTRARAA